MPDHPVPSDRGDDAERPPDLDSDILDQQSHLADSAEADLVRLQTGAAVFASDGAEVAIVESVGPNHIVLLAGFPSRPVDLPASAVAQVSPDGLRLDLRVSSAEIDRVTGENEPGYAHLQAEQPETFSPSREGEPPPGNAAPRPG